MWARQHLQIVRERRMGRRRDVGDRKRGRDGGRGKLGKYGWRKGKMNINNHKK